MAIEVDAAGWISITGAQVVVTHLALDAAEVDSVAARPGSFVENLVENGVMKKFPLPRGE
jgi:hypothetical protein